MQIVVNLIYHERRKHIEIDFHFMRETIQDSLVQTRHISIKEQHADVMRKALGMYNMKRFQVGVKDIDHPPP